MANEFAPIAQRIVNAENAFIDCVVSAVDCDRETAAAVLRLYIKHKIVKLHANSGHYTVKHGAFWDADVLRNAIAEIT